MEAVGPVVRVKLYRDAEGNAKGDALVTYQKDAAVLGAIQLLNGRELRPGQRAGQRWPVDISRPVWNGGAVGAPADRPAGPASTTWSSTSEAAPLEVAAPALVDLRGAAAAPATAPAPAASSIAAPPRLIPGLTRIPGLCEYQAMLSARAQPGKTVAAGAKRSAAASGAIPPRPPERCAHDGADRRRHAARRSGTTVVPAVGGTVGERRRCAARVGRAHGR